MDNQQMLEGCCSTDYIISYSAKILKKVKKTKFFIKKPRQRKNKPHT